MSRLDKFEDILKSYEGRRLDVCPSVVFNNMEWEAIAPKRVNENNKEVFCYDDSQQRILDAGFERHPSSAEAFGLIITHLENRLSPELDEIVQEMLAGAGEFFCQAIETAQGEKGGTLLYFYERVTALPRSAAIDNSYDKSGLKNNRVSVYDVNLEPDRFYSFKDIYSRHAVCDLLIKYLTSRSFNDLPEEIKEKGGIYLPAPGKIWPVGRDGFGEFGIYDCSNGGASRGVRRAQKKVKQ
jgi:hypothetical protein